MAAGPFSNDFDEEEYLAAAREQDLKRVPPIAELVFQALGYASLCWDPKPTGVFDSAEATKVGDELLRTLKARGAK